MDSSGWERRVANISAQLLGTSKHHQVLLNEAPLTLACLQMQSYLRCMDAFLKMAHKVQIQQGACGKSCAKALVYQSQQDHQHMHDGVILHNFAATLPLQQRPERTHD